MENTGILLDVTYSVLNAIQYSEGGENRLVEESEIGVFGYYMIIYGTIKMQEPSYYKVSNLSVNDSISSFKMTIL